MITKIEAIELTHILLFSFCNRGETQSANALRRQRMISETGSGSVADEADRLAFRWMIFYIQISRTKSNVTNLTLVSKREWAEKNSRPSCVIAEVEARKKWDSTHLTGGSVLGRIHLDLAKYHEMDRFTKADSEGYDHAAALYHLRHAADCGDLEAIITLARIALQLPHDVLPDITLEPNLENTDMGFDFMQLVTPCMTSYLLCRTVNVMLCHVMLCYVTLRYVTLRYVTVDCYDH